MACDDPSTYRSAIAQCDFNAYGGVATCPQYTAATKAHGAKCLTLSIFDNGPPFGDFACKGTTGEMATLCKSAGFPSTGTGTGTGTGFPGTVADKGKGTLAKVGGAVVSVGKVAVPVAVFGSAVAGAGFEAAFRLRRPHYDNLTRRAFYNRNKPRILPTVEELSFNEI